MNKYTKIEIFLMIGFLVSTFTFSLTISTVYSKYNKVTEANEFNKDYKHLDISGIHETRYIDGYEVIDEEDDKKNISLLEIIDEVQKAGYKKIILNPLRDQIEIGNNFYTNDIWPCSDGIDIRSQNIIKGRYLTEEELNSNEKVAVIGSGMERVVEEKNGENYIKIFNEDYKVIGVLGDTEVFKYSSVIPIKSLYCINDKLPKVTFLEHNIDNTSIKEIDNKNITSAQSNISKIPVVNYLFKNAYELKNNLYQVILGITNLLLFSYFFAKSIRKKVAIMKVLGAKNWDVFKEVFAKFIRVSSIGIVGGLVLSKFTVDFIRQTFTSLYSEVNIQNIILTSILILLISIVVSISVLFNVIRFKIMKEIR
ncbi:ABC transporter permease [Clostridium uliginosum]|uniref:FtsX-like permease family protein n=1 Tax=Clostridium uliginosum TaxID=119641 RepID=A0A1I1P0A5_9CLOT|nr:ABC transporter permease [Clostridium uliginosum]SFD03096.1 FtsX-like permease family protein [Clostridium uliginosum]